MGACYTDLAQYENAVEAYNSALQNIRVKCQQADVFFRLGNAYSELKQYTEAEDVYKNCITNARQSVLRAGANFGLGEIYKKRGDNQQALRYYEEASRDPNWKKAAEHEIELLKNPGKYSY